MKRTPTVVEGRTICDVCKTDKSWSLLIDPFRNCDKEEAEKLMKEAIINCIKRQNDIVVYPNHSSHIKKLHQATRIINNYMGSI